MPGPGISKDDELTTEGLSRDKSDLLSDHGLGDTALGKAAKKLEEKEEAEAAKRARLVEKKVLLAQAEQQGLGGDPSVSALRADVHDLEGELEAEALSDFRERQDVKELKEQMDPEDKKLLSNFKTLKSQATGEKTREMYSRKIEKLRAKYAE